jgi:hypothetical protein
MHKHHKDHRHLFGALLATALLSAVPTRAVSGPGAFDESMRTILADYLKIQEKLAADSIKGIAEPAQSIAQAASQLDTSSLSGEHAAHLEDSPAKLRDAAEAVGKATDLNAARESFKDLSRPMAMWATMSRPSGVNVVFCDMAKASWLQREGAIRNPYYGSQMLTCGQVVSQTDNAPMPLAHENHDCGCAGGHEQH